MTNQQEPRRGIAAFVGAFNRSHFFEAHEVMEDVWRGVARDRPFRRQVQGMVQLAVAFHHQSKGNPVGARSVLERALRNLSGADDSFRELDLDRLRADLEPWRQYLDECARASSKDKAGMAPRPALAPALPRIQRRSKSMRRR